MINENISYPFYLIFEGNQKSKILSNFYNVTSNINEKENSISYMIDGMIGSNIPIVYLGEIFEYKLTNIQIQELDIKSEYIHDKFLFKKILNCYNDLRNLFDNIENENDFLKINKFKEDAVYLTTVACYFKLFESIYYTNENPILDRSKFKLYDWITCYEKYSRNILREDIKIDKIADYRVKLYRYNFQLFGNEQLTNPTKLNFFKSIAKNNPNNIILSLFKKNIDFTEMTRNVFFKRYSFIYFNLYKLLSFDEKKYEFDSERFEKKADRFFRALK